MKPPASDRDLIVKPKPQHDETRPLIAVTSHAILTEANTLTESAQFFKREHDGARPELAQLFYENPSSIWVCDRALPVLGELDQLLADDERFQFEIFSMPKEAFNPEWTERGYKAIHESYVVNRVGVRATSGKNGKTGLWHLLLDCIDLSGGLPEQTIRAASRVEALMEWGRIIRKLVRDFEIKATPTNGSMAGQILRSPRFYPRPRGKVPRQTNENCRPGLRGNHYDWTQLDPHTTYENVLEIDQRNAHHFSASHLIFPSSDTLYAALSFRRPRKPAATGLLHTAPQFEKWISKSGMYLMQLHFPKLKVPFRPSFLRENKYGQYLVCSNEISHLRTIGIEPYKLIASWTGEPEPEGEGIGAYARYCLRLSDTLPPDEFKAMKRTLLTLYGMLGASPKSVTRYYRQSAQEREPVEIKAGHRMLPALMGEPNTSNPFTANLIQRAMIESETAWRSLNFANELATQGARVLAIYADALYVQTDAPPLLRTPWRIKNEMLTAQFPRTAVVFGRVRGGGVISKVPGGLRREVEEMRRHHPPSLQSARGTDKVSV